MATTSASTSISSNPFLISKPSTSPIPTPVVSTSPIPPLTSSSYHETQQKDVSTPSFNVPSPWIHFIAGGVSGMTGALVTCPLEVVKTRLQSSSNSALTQRFLQPGHIHFTGISSILRNIYRTEGLSALWKGLGPTLLGVIPSRAIYFTAYDESKKVYSQWTPKDSPFVYVASAMTAGVTTTVTTNPLWMVKTRMQLQVSQMSNLYKNSLDCLYKVIKQEGILSLYRGLTASLVGISESTIHWLIYENLKKRYHLHSDRTSKSWHDWWMYLSCAAVSKFTASAITYPHEVIRTRLREPPTILQYKYHGVYHAAVTILREEGVRALYGGMSAHLLRVVPNTAIMFLCYEGVVHFAKNKFQT